MVVNNNIEYAFDASSSAFSCPFVFKIFENIGTKHALNAPSASIFLKKFDILMLTRRASLTAEAPRKNANKMDLTNPVKRDNNVKNPTVVRSLNIFILLYYKVYVVFFDRVLILYLSY